jgi:cytochrome P450
VDKTKIFLSNLDVYARSGEAFELNTLATGLTFDIIGAVILNTDFNAQNLDESQQSPIVTEFKNLLPYYASEKAYQKFMPNYFFRLYRRHQQAKKLDEAIQSLIREKFTRASGEDKSNTSARSVLSLAMSDTAQLTPAILQETSDQIKTFIFAGHDTTTILLQWAIYQLQLHPPALATLRVELDTVLGTDADTPAAILARGDAALRKLTYTSAVIKETLRLYPPAGSARWANPGDGLILTLDDGRTINAEGSVLYICHYAIQRDERVYGADAAEWRPERWMGDVDTSMEDHQGEKGAAAAAAAAASGIPPSAWRPFERGPRNCIGQELANLEARVILACVARRYVFEKVGMGAVVDGVVVGGELLNVSCRSLWDKMVTDFDCVAMADYGEAV